MEKYTAYFLSLLTTLKAHKKPVLIGAGILIGITYITLNIGIWMYAKNSQKKVKPVTSAFPTASPTAGPTPTPTPRPTGPGQYACSPIGTCKDYSDEVRKASCTATYADMFCLDQCKDTTKQCKN
jgi:hypothetical protein